MGGGSWVERESLAVPSESSSLLQEKRRAIISSEAQ
jgi:hypothetical protein